MDAPKLSRSEIEQLVYKVSHELQGPTRHIRSFAEVLAEQLGDDLDVDSSACLDFLIGAVNELDERVHSMTRYSRALSHSYQFEPCAVETIIDEAVSQCSEVIAASGATIDVDHKLDRGRGQPGSILADQEQMVAVVAELLSNAVKFAGENPQIRVVNATEGDRRSLSVLDNGPGFHPEQRQEALELFSRFHDDGFPGTGAGLAIALSIVQKHGGELSVGASCDGGAELKLLMPSLTSSDVFGNEATDEPLEGRA